MEEIDRPRGAAYLMCPRGETGGGLLEIIMTLSVSAKRASPVNSLHLFQPSFEDPLEIAYPVVSLPELFLQSDPRDERRITGANPVKVTCPPETLPAIIEKLRS